MSDRVQVWLLSIIFALTGWVFMYLEGSETFAVVGGLFYVSTLFAFLALGMPKGGLSILSDTERAQAKAAASVGGGIDTMMQITAACNAAGHEAEKHRQRILLTRARKLLRKAAKHGDDDYNARLTMWMQDERDGRTTP